MNPTWSHSGHFVTEIEEEDWEGAEWIGFSKLDPEKRIVPGIHVPGSRKEWKNMKER